MKSSSKITSTNGVFRDSVSVWMDRAKLCQQTSFRRAKIYDVSCPNETWRYKRGGFHPWTRKIPLEKEMTIRSSFLDWKIPWTEQPDRLQSVGLQRVGHDWVTSLTHSLKLPISMVSLLRYTNTNMIKILSKWVTVSKVVLIFRLYYWSFFKKACSHNRDS